MPDEPQTPAAAPTGTTATEVQTEWPEEFVLEDGSQDTKAMAKAYGNLRHKMSTTRPTEPQLKVPGGAAEPEPLPETATSADHLRQMGFDPEALAKQFKEKDHLTPKQYEAFEKKGIPRVMVDENYRNALEVATVRTEKAYTASVDFAGGEEQLKNLAAWASQTVPQDQQAALQARLSNPATMLEAVKGIWADHHHAIGAGNANPLISGDPAPTSGGGFSSQEEAFAAQRDPRYKKDKAHREAVNARIGKTPDAIMFPG